MLKPIINVVKGKGDRGGWKEFYGRPLFLMGCVPMKNLSKKEKGTAEKIWNIRAAGEDGAIRI